MENILPEKFVERLTKLLPEDNLTEYFALSGPPLVSFRVNTIKATREEISEKLTRLGFDLQNAPWYEDAFILTGKSKRELTETSLYKEGKFYIQNLSSMLPALILDPKPHENVLDLAASPGSKTTQIAAMMQNKGLVVANDQSRARIFKLLANLKQFGVTNTKVVNLPGQMIWKRFPEYFDKTLVDVPCSMEGLIRADDPKSFEGWSLKRIKILSKLQTHLLRSAVSATKVGGLIVYSTCTLSPEENEGVVDWLLKKEGDAVRLEKIELPLALHEGITAWQKPFSSEVKKCARVFPGKEMEGFFMAKMRKIRPTVEL